MTRSASLSHNDYTAGWICALPVETAAAKLMLDEIHPPFTSLARGSKHIYSGKHRETQYCHCQFTERRLWEYVSYNCCYAIAVQLSLDPFWFNGDVVVSKPTHTFGGVIQFDLGKLSSCGQFKRTGMLDRPPKVLLTAIATLQAHHLIEDTRVVEFITSIQAKTAPHKAKIFARPTQEDCLFQADYDHIASNACEKCDRAKLFPRAPRGHQEPVIHYGLIGSANQVVKDGRRRDELARDFGVLCVEMEAAGLMHDFPCLVVRGICDYADSHKNKEWQGYAAAAAAAYTKELFLVIPADDINNAPTAQDTLAASVQSFDIPLDLTAMPVIENFLGREDELDKLWQYLQPTSFQSRKVAILHSLGGMGKTQLAIRFARDHKHDFSAIFWLDGKDRSTLLHSLSCILPRLPGQPRNMEVVNEEKVEQRAKHVLRWLALEENSRWLIILDNVDQYSPANSLIGDAYDVREFLPAADHGSILITSRLQDLTELGKSFPVHRLNSKDAIQLLLHSTHSHPSAKNSIREIENNPDTITLMNHLDGLPLAIAIAGAFMRETGTNITKYLQYYQESWSELQFQSNPGREYQQGNILQTWMISYHEIQKRDPDAAKLLLLLAHFDSQDIWYELLQSARRSTRVPVWLDRITASELAFKAKVRILIKLSLLQAKGQEGSYLMHPVVQNWCRHVARADRNANLLNELALISVGYTVPSLRDGSYWELQQRLIPHANYICQWNWSGENTAVLKALNSLGLLYSDQGKLQEAEEMFRRALAGREKALGPHHTSTLHTVNNLGNLYSYQGKLLEAEEMFRRALEGREKVLGLDHTSTLGTVNNLGNLYSYQGKLQEAEEMYQRALAGREKALGPDHMSTLGTVNNLGNLYSYQGKLEEAEEMYQRALAGRKKALGPDHISTLRTVNNLGAFYLNQGKLQEAEEMYQRALAGREKTLGPHHTSTLNTVNNLGNLYSYQGKLQEAEEMYQRALAGREKALGSDHISTLGTINNLGNLFSSQGKLQEAEGMYQRALVGREKALGPDHASTLDTIKNLGNLFSDQGKLQKAEGMYQRALKAAGDEIFQHPNILGECRLQKD
ncbi:hypothetical protein N7493_001268 [Penicillium malachiteum]|uniref:NB-ARC domain-containing protein n=1 Tax=Penicillium malachiteum TaxID=1324776 RepID=A0AAD6HUK6_9EURO|nr:hypothetical protein N7493_001268 [Penicillium malachiteum]